MSAKEKENRKKMFGVGLSLQIWRFLLDLGSPSKRSEKKYSAIFTKGKVRRFFSIVGSGCTTETLVSTISVDVDSKRNNKFFL